MFVLNVMKQICECRPAQRHARDMAARDYYNDIDPDGNNTYDRFAEIGLAVGNVRPVYWGKHPSSLVSCCVPQRSHHRKDADYMNPCMRKVHSTATRNDVHQLLCSMKHQSSLNLNIGARLPHFGAWLQVVITMSAISSCTTSGMTHLL